MKQTAVEFMVNELLYLDNEFDMKLIDKNEYQVRRKQVTNQAKEMEKEQILRAYDIGSNEGYDLAKIDYIEEGHYMKEPIEYYNETFK